MRARAAAGSSPRWTSAVALAARASTSVRAAREESGSGVRDGRAHSDARARRASAGARCNSMRTAR